jgi:putative transposase
MVRSMPRPSRVDLAEIPQHIVQRGVDRRPCFVHEIHYREYLHYLLEESARFGCRIHAYVLMCNHVHLLATPTAAGGIGRLMQGLGRRYVGLFNHTMERTGTLWDGRYKSCLVDSESYLLRCYRYIELNPVRAGICSRPSDHAWSSFRCNGMGTVDPLISPHDAYLSLAATSAARLFAYRQFVAQGCQDAELDSIRAMTARHRAVGSEEFKRKLESSCARPMGFARRGRPPGSAELK